MAACSDKVANLRAHGFEAEATVADKREDVSQRAKRRDFFLTLTFFAEDSATKAKADHQHDILSDTTKSMADRLDQWHPGQVSIGTYTRVEIEVQERSWSKLKVGDNVKVRYLPDDPTTVMLADEL